MAEWRRFRAEQEIGWGAETFQLVAGGIEAWGIQRGAGLRVTAEPGTPTPVTLGGEYVVRIGIGLLGIDAPVRVCEIVDDRGVDSAREGTDIDDASGVVRRGFAYETREGHPEEGTEWFVVEHDLATDRVRFVVTADARAATWYARLGGPVTRRVQDLCTRRYLRAAADLAAGDNG